MARLYDWIAWAEAPWPSIPFISIAGGVFKLLLCYDANRAGGAGNRDTTVRSELCKIGSPLGLLRLTASVYGVWLQTDHDVRGCVFLSRARLILRALLVHPVVRSAHSSLALPTECVRPGCDRFLIQC